MKKVLSIILFVAAVFTLCITPALAASFTNVIINCTSTSDNNLTPLGDSWKSTSAKKGKVYVYHSVNGVSERYTNRFKIVNLTSGAQLGIGWATPKQNTPIYAPQLQKETTITLYARGNTKYYEQSPYFSSIAISGTYGWPL